MSPPQAQSKKASPATPGSVGVRSPYKSPLFGHWAEETNVNAIRNSVRLKDLIKVKVDFIDLDLGRKIKRELV